MFYKLCAAGVFAGLVVVAAGAGARAAALPASRATPAPTASPTAGWSFSGYDKAYYFSRENASNNPGAQFDFTPKAKYVSNGVNQASFSEGVQLQAQYAYADGWNVAAGYFLGSPFDGPCSVAANHTASGAAASGISPACNRQIPPATNPDDTLPGFTLSTLDEAYVAYDANGISGKVGDQVILTPWATTTFSRMKPDVYQGVDLAYAPPGGASVEAMDMVAFEDRDASAFSRTTLITSYPAGSPGLPANLFYPGGRGVQTGGFFMGRLGYASPPATANPWSADGYLYAISDIATIYWSQAKYAFANARSAPFVALQGGWESNAGASYVGKIDSQIAGIELGDDPTKNIEITGALDVVPWHRDTVTLPKGTSCNAGNDQIAVTPGSTLAYWLPIDAAQCFTDANTGRTQIEYGGWAGPYTDSYNSDPLFTTQQTQGMISRRSPGTSYKIAASFTSNDRRFVFSASNAWFDYGNALGPQRTKEWDLDGQYHLSRVSPATPYRGLLLHYRYGERVQSNTYCGGAGTVCPAADAYGQAYYGGLPLYKDNRAELEYDF